MIMQPYSDKKARLPRYRRAPNFEDKVVGRPKQRILDAVGRYRFLTAKQLARLLFSLSSISYVRKHLAELYHNRYLQRVYLPTITPHGSSAAVYCLDNRGRTWLRNPGHERFRASEQAHREPLFLRHTLASIDILVAAQRIAELRPRTRLTSFLTEYELKQKKLPVHVRGEKLSVEPDGWLDFEHGDEHVYIAVEVDRATEDREAFRRKVRGYLGSIAGPFQAAFDADNLTVAVVTTGGERRLRDLLSWTEAELNEQDARAQSEIFLFAALDPGVVLPIDLFFAPLFQCPFDAALVSLLPGMDEG